MNIKLYSTLYTRPRECTDRTFRDLHRTLPKPCKARGRIKPGIGPSRRSRRRCHELGFRDQQSPVSSDRDRKGNAIDLCGDLAILQVVRTPLPQPASGSVAAAWS